MHLTSAISSSIQELFILAEYLEISSYDWFILFCTSMDMTKHKEPFFVRAEASYFSCHKQGVQANELLAPKSFLPLTYRGTKSFTASRTAWKLQGTYKESACNHFASSKLPL